ncbi:MAG: bifunctional [glutamate--ammonia ligase]-adenylyl-L-tyrosine phosphorylase/[glutamate--ammonia-ligase] adenylyltransferase [Candidatus Rokubacteria bacterium]|nr:bifunctional [glutamate--ammonia ligase]-adenylyl-L-tyrosine phosphorylase/[glutamate--ammonia-ligase] adenylyltransferase [Candidatus Rokubacteria bacterium]
MLAPAWPRLLAELAAAPDPDMALNNLERYAEVVNRAELIRTLASHPGAAHLLARLGGSSQFLADTLRRRPSDLAWLLEPRAMRQWLPEDLATDLAQSVGALTTRETRMNALRRFKYRQILRIGARDLLDDADLAVTTEELAHLADVCLAAAWRWADAAARAQYGAPIDADGRETGMAIIGMGKLGGEELNYSSDIDLMFVYGADGETAGGPAGALSNGAYFERVSRDIVETLEAATDEGYAFRVDLRLRPEGRMGPMILSLDGYRTYYAERAELWERQALLKARIVAGDEAVGHRFSALAREVVYRPGVDERILAAVRGMKREIDRQQAAKRDARENVKLGRGGIREIEFLVQAMQLLYGGDDSWLRERTSLKAIFRLTERGYLAPELGRMLSHAYVHLRTVEHRLQILHEFQTHSLPAEPLELGRLARRLRFAGSPALAARRFRAEHRRVTAEVHRAFRDFFADRPRAAAPRLRLPSLIALQATGFADPDRARANLRLVLEGRPLVPYAGAMGAALGRLYPMLLDALWKSPDPDEALNQFERFLAAVGPRAGLVEMLAANGDVLLGLIRLCAGGDLLTQLLIAQPELLSRLADPAALQRPKREADFRAALAAVFAPGLDVAERRDTLRRQKQAEELTIVWRYLLGVTTVERYSREMTALAEATLAAGWLLVLAPLVERHGVPRDADRRFVPGVTVGLGKVGGRELTTGSDLDVFVVFGDDGTTDGPEPIENHTFYSEAVERLGGALGDITAAGVAFPVDLRLRPGSKGSGFASSVAALARYYDEYGDLWERQTLTRARVLDGDRRLARAVRRALRTIVYGAPLPHAALKEIVAVRKRMELELGKETPGRVHAKFGKGGLVDVEFLAQALQLVHGAGRPDVRRANTTAALRALARAGVLANDRAEALAEHYRFLRRVSAALRLLGARPADVLDLAGPMPARVATALGYPSRQAFLDDYRRRTDAVRAGYREALA